MILALLVGQFGLNLPANTAYVSEGETTLSRSGEILYWNDPKTQILWGGRLQATGTLHVQLDVTGATSGITYHLKVEGAPGNVTRSAPESKPDFGDFEVKKAGWTKFTLTAEGSGGYGNVRGLNLSGAAVAHAQFNLKERRNAASVHIGYPVAPDTQIEWMYNEVKAKTDPLYTYYEACGFSRGYFGMQVNGPSERRVIFSVWDAGSEAKDRNKVGDENRVRLLAKGPDVVAGDFGNEGTGGHSHLVTPWKTAVTQKFLVHAVKDGDGTIYSGYYFMPEKRDWQLIASFRAPKDNGLIRGMYAFNEDFAGENGNLLRAAEFGPTWIRTTDGVWQQCKVGKFTHDKTGGVDRFDYDFKVVGDHFMLQNGGFTGASPQYGQLLTVDRPAAAAPKIDLKRLTER